MEDAIGGFKELLVFLKIQWGIFQHEKKTWASHLAGNYRNQCQIAELIGHLLIYFLAQHLTLSSTEYPSTVYQFTMQ